MYLIIFPPLKISTWMAPRYKKLFGFIQCSYWTKTHWSWTAARPMHKPFFSTCSHFYLFIYFLSHTLLWGSSWIINVERLNAPYSGHRSCSERLPRSHSWLVGAGLENKSTTSIQQHTLEIYWRCFRRQLMEDISTPQIELQWIIKKETVICEWRV